MKICKNQFQSHPAFLSLFISMTTANQGTLPLAAHPIIAVHEVQLHMGGSSDSFC